MHSHNMHTDTITLYSLRIAGTVLNNSVHLYSTVCSGWELNKSTDQDSASV